MVFLNKQASKLIDNRLKRKEKDYYDQIEIFNIEAAAIHKKLLLELCIEDFAPVTNYVNQFISHTTIWYLKFKTNLQNLEVATLQLLHLHFIFKHIGQERFAKEYVRFTQLQQDFLKLSEYAAKQYELHYAKINALVHGEN